MSATVFLWDDSHWGDIPTGRDGMVGYTHKLTDGLRYYEDPEYRAAMNAVRPMGFTVLGAYHMLHGGVSVTEQARWLVARASALTPWWRDWPYWVWQIDAEPLAYLTRPSVAECNAFGEAVMAEAGAPRNSVLGYLASWSYGAAVQGLRFPFWNSNYGANPAVPYRQAYPGNDSPRWVGGGRRGDFLQYGSRTIVAGQPTSDASAFAGTLDELKAFLRPGGTQPSTMEDDMGFTQQQADDIAFTLLSADGKPLHVRMELLEQRLAAIEAAIKEPAPVNVDPAAVAAAVAAKIADDPQFAGKLAAAIVGELSTRLQQ